ncbi:bifunctional D-glycero-beta-D-manno-heptose-7-phosphate kinase/D-glycero-beta-D-manno-heptose 1-phosphate adenylyltransferase HldE [uncultured Bacteroides sp.]|uniref:bifunctional D-glycero-beta-D-manno-heptose-7-phosphate kinase/D-glycero-beta-D-manno-heptose 1-phosphate adenylyltransferase HldE n=1 Tax=uncultured Bacteroides sp. TaxID=162156 RepID=UPI002593C085|nr:bifunctional D-glycero-beta-D-manno-heptose-7-phosphate kinase/D-glycero-beta-D-manno-heptose 1-phosphate adenylyltransferase HldE [uncultured Bacteroides sp.]
MELDITRLVNKKILVIGDVMIDTYHIGKVKRISPEAPVPIVQVSQSYSVLGGAANVARNLVSLGCKAVVVGLVGGDANGGLMKEMLADLHIDNDLMNVNHPTITKIRILGNNQQIVRIDFEQDKFVLSTGDEEVLAQIIKKNISQCDAVVISDYGKGFCTYDVCQRAIAEAKRNNKFVIVDPKGTDWSKYAGATIVTPNLKELSDIIGCDIENEDKVIHEKSIHLLSQYQLDYLLVTRSEKGMTLTTLPNCYDIKTEAREVFDVSGAGDTVVATLSAALAALFPLLDAVYLSNKAAGIVVGKMGTTPIYYDELFKSIESNSFYNKLIDRSRLKEILFTLHAKQQKVVFTNGCFDVLHKGHVFYLQEAKKYGDILIVGLNSDASVKRLKGDSRPINKAIDRAAVLEALKCVDLIVIFDEDTPYNLIKEVQPDVLVKGGDYEVENVVGREFSKKVVLIDFQRGYSSTNIIHKLEL